MSPVSIWNGLRESVKRHVYACSCVLACACALESTLCIKEGHPFLLNISIEMATGWPLGRGAVAGGGNRRNTGYSLNTLLYLLAYLLCA